jgi:hypothetical protein
MEDFAWIVLFATVGYWLAILISGIKTAIEGSHQNNRDHKQASKMMTEKD